ncbi:malto-oligosyltrehalose synthase [Agromyces aerolatus]|uniref:malto-oligosyltrehalose synthase n=1 Tax=Agromyces sp. LY-1074 TaxID=3074080 RepID=UPI0028655737|nr:MULTISPECIES: malto-oligosyltrehalose synthase [unclassified Agromyces]MDR5700499.1 malto-oligosyltrehalose synthase [Agromyces sp. LY-1074]MDR5707020.1 malto-oligosyltrehalose synthase [Agromyces sp. LY-1358]
MSAAPVSTYRIQVRASFDLHAVAGIADYLHDLGADWLYLSPLLEAEPGSDHGYDVVDHSRVDPARGGRDGLDAASRAAHDLGMGVLADLVPNHVGVATPAAMAWWWDVLANGRASRYAEAFDIDWEFGEGRLRLPVLGSADDVAELRLVPVSDAAGADGSGGGEFELRYFDHRFPVASGTAHAGDDPAAVHDRQHYELIDWRRADHDLNYRRFFAVNTLAAIRVELPWVFDESHVEVLRWLRDGLVDGLRIDHPDGLLDPGGYLARLAEETRGAYVLVEKILEGDERMPAEWATEGTTGYDALADVDRVLVDPAGERRLTELDAELRGGTADWAAMIHGTKRAIADGILRSEVLRLDRMLVDATDATDATDAPGAVADAVAELLAWFPVYRSYLPFGVEHLHEAAERTIAHRPELAPVVERLLPILSDPAHPAAIRFQQTSGMVMAKGVEDTAFYRYTRLTSLTEVGGDPSEFAIPTAEFHARQRERFERMPRSMTTLSTHDTKRGEDVRARIDAIAEVPAEWTAMLGELRELAPLGDGPFEHLLWQAVVGAWPASRERLHAYAEKAAREAGNSTTWTEPDRAFEARMHAAVDAVFDDERVGALVARAVALLEGPGWSNSLSAKLIQLTAPGVPDVYQGSELWEQSLVDPDNRRPVDFGLRRRMLAELDAGALPPIDADGAAKLLVTSRALRLRRDRPDLFSDYMPLAASGDAAGHLVAFDRGGAIALATRLPIGLAARGGWGDTVVDVGSAPVIDVLTGRHHQGGELRLADVLDRYPVALLVEVEGKA